MMNNISDIVFNSLCLSCGTCVYVCPQKAVTLQETPGGLLVAKVNDSECTGCGLCLKVCPGDHLNSGVLPQEIDPFKGQVLSAYCGKATNTGILNNSQSGGIATALLCYLLGAEEIDNALVTQMPQDGSLRPICKLTSDTSEIMHAQGSKYCPVPLNACLPQAKECDLSKIAVVGLPCHFHGICNMASKKRYERPLLIGLICERVMSFSAMEYLVKKSGFPRSSVKAMRYKDKSFGGWPGNIAITSNNSQKAAVSSHHRMWCKGVFTPPRCYLCFDKMNVLSDIVLGDAWGVKEDKQGASVILARTERGIEVIEKAQQAGVIQVDSIEAEAVFKGQHIEAKRRDWTAFTAVWRQICSKTPNVGIQSKWLSDISDVDLKAHSAKMMKAIMLTEVISTKKMLINAHRKYNLSRIKNKILTLMRMKSSIVKKQ